MTAFARRSPFVPYELSDAKEGLSDALAKSTNFTDLIAGWGKRGGGRSRTQTQDPNDPLGGGDDAQWVSPFAPIPHNGGGASGSPFGPSGDTYSGGAHSLGGGLAGGYTGAGSPSAPSGGSAPGSTTSGPGGPGSTVGGTRSGVGAPMDDAPTRNGSQYGTIQGPAAPAQDDSLAQAGREARAGIADMANNRDRAEAVFRSEVDPTFAAPAPSPIGDLGNMGRTQNGVSLPDPNAPPTIDIDQGQMYGPTRAEMSPNISIANVRSVGMEEALAAREAAAMKADREMHEAKPEDEQAPSLKSGPELVGVGIDVGSWANNTKEVEDALAAATQAAPFTGAPDVVGLGPQDKVEDMGPLGPAQPAPASWDAIEASLKDMETRSAELDARAAARDAELAQLANQRFGLESAISAQEGARTGANAFGNRTSSIERDEEQQSPFTNVGPLSGFQEAIDGINNAANNPDVSIGPGQSYSFGPGFEGAFSSAFGTGNNYGYGVETGLRDVYGNNPFDGAESITGRGAASGPKGPMGIGIDQDLTWGDNPFGNADTKSASIAGQGVSWGSAIGPGMSALGGSPVANTDENGLTANARGSLGPIGSAYNSNIQVGPMDPFAETPGLRAAVNALGIDEDQQATPTLGNRGAVAEPISAREESQVDPTNNYNNNLVTSIEDMFGGIGNISNQGQRPDALDYGMDFGVKDEDMLDAVGPGGLPGMSETSKPTSPFGPGPEMDQQQSVRDEDFGMDPNVDAPAGMLDGTYDGAPVGLGMGSGMSFGGLSEADMASMADALGSGIEGVGAASGVGGYGGVGVGDNGMTDTAYGGIDTSAFGDMGAFGGWGGFDGFGGFDGMGGGFDGGGGDDTSDDDDGGDSW